MGDAKRQDMPVRSADPSADSVSIPLSPDETAMFESGPLPALPGAAGLNPRYTFDSFIVGSSNQFANAACRAVAEAPSRSYNPLFIYGGGGVGQKPLVDPGG